jgi:YHS domain-containing protein
MPRSAAISCLFLGLACACNDVPSPKPALKVEAVAAPEHTVTTDAPVHVASAEPAAAATSCGGEGHAGCCQGDGACGAVGHSTCGGGADHAASCGANAPMQAQEQVNALTRIEDPSQVCMVRNHFMGRQQLAVQADGSTYYGCCPGCANRLLQDPQARKAIDPVSHNPVDKGLAVLARTSRGSVLYFENEANLQLFRATMQ